MSTSKSKRPENQKIVIKILTDDFDKLGKYAGLILRYIDLDRKVPPIIIKRIIDLTYRPGKEFKKYLNNIKEDAIQMAKKFKLDYEIKIKRKASEPNEGDMPDLYPPFHLQKDYDSISFAYFIEYFFTLLENEEEEEFLNIIGNKQTFIEHAYSLLFNYLKRLTKLIPKSKHPSAYSKKLLIGVLAVSFELFDKEEEYISSPSSAKYYTEYLVNKTGYFCNKLEETLLKVNENK